MDKERTAPASPLLRGLFQAGIYKRNQGRIARQVTFAFLLAGTLIGVWRFYSVASGWLGGMRTAVCGGLALAATWIVFRIVNMPRFADFLIAVEAEMNKVSWPTQTQLIRSVLVVMFTIAFLVTVLACYDLFWNFLLTQLGIGT